MSPTMWPPWWRMYRVDAVVADSTAIALGLLEVPIFDSPLAKANGLATIPSDWRQPWPVWSDRQSCRRNRRGPDGNRGRRRRVARRQRGSGWLTR